MGEQVVGQGGGGADDVLAVVQEEEHPPRRAVLGEAYEGVGGGAVGGPQFLGPGAAQHGLAGAERGQDRLGHGVRVVDGSQFGQPDALGPLLGSGLGGLLGQPGLAGAAGSEQGDEPGAAEILAQGGDVGVPSDETGEPGPEVARDGPGGRRGPAGRRPPVGRWFPAEERLPAERRFLVEQFGVQGAQGRAGRGAEAVVQQGAHLLVRGQGLGGAAGVPQGPDAQRLERFVERTGVAEHGQLRQRLPRPAEGQEGAERGPPGVEPAGLPAGRGRRPVGKIGEGGPVPQGERLLQGREGLLRVAVLQGPAPLPRQPLEPVQVHGVRRGGEAVAALRGLDGAVAQGAPQPSDEGLERTGGVGGGIAVPHLADQDPCRNGPPGAQREDGEEGAQPRPAEGDGRAVVAECPGGAENAVVHGPIVRDGRRTAGDRGNSTSGRRRSGCAGPYDHPSPYPRAVPSRPRTAPGVERR